MELRDIYCLHPIELQQSRQETFRTWGKATAIVYTPQLKCFAMQKDIQFQFFVMELSDIYCLHPSHYINQIANVQK